MIRINKEKVVEKVKDTLIQAGSHFSEDKFQCYQNRIETEENGLSRWAMETILENAIVAGENKSPLCDDTGIPHIILEIGRERYIDGIFMEAVYEGVKSGLRELPGRPMAIMGCDEERISQSGGLAEDSDAVVPAPVMIRYTDEDDQRLRVTIMMQGGGPEIRAKTYRVFHKHSMDVVLEEIIDWAKEVVGQLGCTPCTLAVGVGRSHYEASSMMLQAMSEGNYNIQNDYERRITNAVNEENVGAMGFGGKNSVLATFMKVGPQRASGVRIVCMRPCCCFEPRKSSVDF